MFKIAKTVSKKQDKIGIQTPWMQMCVEAYSASWPFTVSALGCGWLILAGFITFPNTFTSVTHSQTLKSTQGGRLVQQTVRNVPLLAVASVMSGIGIVGSFVLWFIWRVKRDNPLWIYTNVLWFVSLPALATMNN